MGVNLPKTDTYYYDFRNADLDTSSKLVIARDSASLLKYRNMKTAVAQLYISLDEIFQSQTICTEKVYIFTE